MTNDVLPATNLVVKGQFYLEVVKMNETNSFTSWTVHGYPTWNNETL